MIKINNITIKKLQFKDANHKYLRWLNKNSISKFIENKNKIGNIIELKKYVITKINANNVIFLAIFLNNKLHIGNIKFEPINKLSNYTIIGVMIGENKYIGKGIGTICIKECIKWVNKRYNISNFYLGVSKHNHIAIKSYKKIGFVNINNRYSYLKKKHDQIIMKCSLK